MRGGGVRGRRGMSGQSGSSVARAAGVRLWGQDESPPRQTQGDWGGRIPPREETSRGPGRSGRKTKPGRESRGGPRRGVVPAAGGPAAPGLPSPVRHGSARPAGGAARRSHLHCSSGGRRSAPGPPGWALSAALHCSTAGAPSFPAPFSSLRRRSAPGAQPGARDGPAELRSCSHGSPSRATTEPSRERCRGAGDTQRPCCAPCRPGRCLSPVTPARVEGAARPVGAAAVPPACPRAPRCGPSASSRHQKSAPSPRGRRSCPPRRAAGFAWTRHCPASSSRASRNHFGSVGRSRGGSVAPPGPADLPGVVPGRPGSRGCPSGRCPTGRSPRRRGTCAARGAGREGRPASSSGRTGQGGWRPRSGLPRPGTATRGPAPARRAQVLRGPPQPRPAAAGRTGRGGDRGDPGGKQPGGGRASRDLPRRRVRGAGGVPGPRPGGAPAPAHRGPVPKAPALCLLWENASTVTKWRGKGGIVTASPAALPARPPPAPGRPRGARSGAGSEAGSPPPGHRAARSRCPAPLRCSRSCRKWLLGGAR